MEIITAFGSAILSAALLGALSLTAFLSYRFLATLVTVNREIRQTRVRAKRERQLIGELETEGFTSADAEEAVRSTRS